MKNLSNQIKPFVIWGIADLYFVFAVTITIIFGVLSPDIKNQLALTNAQLGLLGFGFFLSFGVTQLLTGNLIDTLGPRISLSVAAIVSAIGLFLFSNATEFKQAFAGQIIMGAGLSPSFVGAVYLASNWFSKKYFSLFSGLTLMSANIISASMIVILAITKGPAINFRAMMMSLAIVSLILSFLLFLIVRKPDLAIETSNEKRDVWKDLRNLFEIPQFWLGTIYFSCTIGVYLSFSSLWNVPDSLAYGHDLKTATLLSATIRYGVAIGALLAGALASYLGSYSTLARIYSTGALLLAFLLVYGPIFPLPIVYLVYLTFGYFMGGTALGFPLAGQWIPADLKGTGFGLMAALGYLVSAFVQYITGLLLSVHVLPSEKPNIHDFTIALTPLFLIIVLGWLCTLWLKDQSSDNRT